jgi:hypothetical protein
VLCTQFVGAEVVLRIPVQFDLGSGRLNLKSFIGGSAKGNHSQTFT